MQTFPWPAVLNPSLKILLTGELSLLFLLARITALYYRSTVSDCFGFGILTRPRVPRIEQSSRNVSRWRWKRWQAIRRSGTVSTLGPSDGPETTVPLRKLITNIYADNWKFVPRDVPCHSTALCFNAVITEGPESTNYLHGLSFLSTPLPSSCHGVSVETRFLPSFLPSRASGSHRARWNYRLYFDS